MANSPVFPPLQGPNGDQREPTVKETCRVLPMLDRHFLNHRYEEGWSDEVIAEKLKLPRVIVCKVREESPEHGAIASDPDIVHLRQDITSVKALVAEMEHRLDRLEQANQRHGR